MSALERSMRVLARVGLMLAAAALLVSLVAIGYSVVMRYVFGAPVAWTDELVGYLLVASVMLAAPDALLEGEHISVDIVTERLAARGRKLAYLFGLAAVAATALLLLVEGLRTVEFSRMVGLRSNGYLALPLWMPQLLIPAGALLLLLAAAVAFLRGLREGAPQRENPMPPAGLE
jgi:TRAP-type C4-dicarboxylate transport system permease small subunit